MKKIIIAIVSLCIGMVASAQSWSTSPVYQTYHFQDENGLVSYFDTHNAVAITTLKGAFDADEDNFAPVVVEFYKGRILQEKVITTVYVVPESGVALITNHMHHGLAHHIIDHINQVGDVKIYIPKEKDTQFEIKVCALK